jgi:hypothetical protein
LELFDKPCRMVIDTPRLESLHIRGSALEMHNPFRHVRVVAERETSPVQGIRAEKSPTLSTRN